jgi:hypothetical protein
LQIGTIFGSDPSGIVAVALDCIALSFIQVQNIHAQLSSYTSLGRASSSNDEASQEKCTRYTTGHAFSVPARSLQQTSQDFPVQDSRNETSSVAESNATTPAEAPFLTQEKGQLKFLASQKDGSRTFSDLLPAFLTLGTIAMAAALVYRAKYVLVRCTVSSTTLHSPLRGSVVAPAIIYTCQTGARADARADVGQM